MVAFEDDRDDFWDVSKLVPKKRTPLSQFSSSPKVRDFSVSEVVSLETEKKTSNEDRKIDIQTIRYAMS